MNGHQGQFGSEVRSGLSLLPIWDEAQFGCWFVSVKHDGAAVRSDLVDVGPGSNDE